jgi:hypothetical protein
LGKGAGVMEENRACFRESGQGRCLRRLYLSRYLREVRGVWRKSWPNRGNCECKGPEGECAIYSDGERFVGSRSFLFWTCCIEVPSGHPETVTRTQE